MNTLIGAGIDIGSATIKLAVTDGKGVLVRREVVDAGFDPRATAENLLSSLPKNAPMVATGYGRDLVDAPSITELKAHALGARFLFPDCSCLIDIGGQDVKVVCLDDKGKVAKFEMNDRCAAGTGKFLEIMAGRLGFTMEEFSSAALAGNNPVTISSMCTVFAESEVVGLINRGRARQDIAAALHRAVVVRVTSMYKRLEPGPGRIVLCGGGGRNRALAVFLEKAIENKLTIAADPQIVGALGCALEAGKQGGSRARPDAFKRQFDLL
jgi:predicted CoA-substrate-specific enzyme activase